MTFILHSIEVKLIMIEVEYHCAMDAFSLRKAKRDDAPRIRSLVIEGNINPFGLNWRRFIIAEDPTGRVIGCVQLKPHQDGSVELASLVVDRLYQGQGIARKLIETMIAIHAGGLYLTCRSELGGFYKKFGFQVLSADELHGYFRAILRLVNLLQKVTGREEGLLVMWRDCGAAESIQLG